MDAAKTTNRPFTEDMVMAVLVNLCAGIACMHRYSIAHRDIKPDNIFMAADGVVKVRIILGSTHGAWHFSFDFDLCGSAGCILTQWPHHTGSWRKPSRYHARSRRHEIRTELVDFRRSPEAMTKPMGSRRH
jgi:serine/threonine protein kinase